MKKTQTRTYQKPIDVDIHFKYTCPNDQCSNHHWISLGESKTVGFKVVCDCGFVFKPKPVSKIKICYRHKKQINGVFDKKTNSGKIALSECSIKALKTMIALGYSEKEARLMIVSVKNYESIDDHLYLVKLAISKIGE